MATKAVHWSMLTSLLAIVFLLSRQGMAMAPFSVSPSYSNVRSLLTCDGMQALLDAIHCAMESMEGLVVVVRDSPARPETNPLSGEASAFQTSMRDYATWLRSEQIMRNATVADATDYNLEGKIRNAINGCAQSLWDERGLGLSTADAPVSELLKFLHGLPDPVFLRVMLNMAIQVAGDGSGAMHPRSHRQTYLMALWRSQDNVDGCYAYLERLYPEELKDIAKSLRNAVPALAVSLSSSQHSEEIKRLRDNECDETSVSGSASPSSSNQPFKLTLLPLAFLTLFMC